MKNLTIMVNHLGELDAGIMPYSEEVKISIASGDLGGWMHEQEFKSELLSFFRFWYEGAKVTMYEDEV